MAILNDVKIRLRVSVANTAFDADITALIAEAKKDIQRAGIMEASIIDTDPAIIRAIVLYCKTYFDLNNPDFERWAQSYESMKISLALDADYKVVAEVV